MASTGLLTIVSWTIGTYHVQLILILTCVNLVVVYIAVVQASGTLCPSCWVS